MVVLCVVVAVLLIQMNKQQSLTAETQVMAEEINTARDKFKQVNKEKENLAQSLNSTFHNLTVLGHEYDQLKLLMNTTSHNVTLLSVEKTQLSQLLKNTFQEKTQLEVENKVLNKLLNKTLERRNLVYVENTKLKVVLNESLRVIEQVFVDNKRLHTLLDSERQTSAVLEANNQHQRSIIFNSKLSILQKYCNNDTLECSRCMPGWVENDARCYFLSPIARKWENARKDCLDMGSDLAIVLSREEQAFLTNLTFQFVQQHPEINFHSAWIGLQDMVKEGTHVWINGNTPKYGAIFWKELEPNNAIASWDHEKSGQDCVAIVPPKRIDTEDWLNTWDDIVCGGRRHYICETKALILT